MALRTINERVVQALLYETCGLLLATPAYALVFGTSSADSAVVLVALAVAVLVWTPLYNLVFDRVEWRLSERLASDRPVLGRILHAGLLEMSVLVLTVPILVFLGGHGWKAALLIDFGLSFCYGIYSLGFYRIYDWLFPMKPATH
jgi:uncharacterized membrane protein